MALNDQIPTHAATVTPSDTTEQFGSALVCGGSGTVVMVTEGGDTVTFAVTAGQTLIMRFRQIKAASSAASLVRVW
jgi:hypothetical protein